MQASDLWSEPDAFAQRALSLWPETEGGSVTLINVSENHTYRVAGRAGTSYILRLHRPGYHSRPGIESEIAWIGALRAETDINLPKAIAGRNGSIVQTVQSEGFGQPRQAVLFAFEVGQEPDATSDLTGLFAELGRIAAKLHLNALCWDRPAFFTRPTWTAPKMLDRHGVWGDWRMAPGVDDRICTILSAADQKLRDDLACYGDSADRFGLIHADMRLANLLVKGAGLTVIDFDDCGYGWLMYDFAAAVSFMETKPELPHWKAAWVEGYRGERPLGEEHVAMLETMVMLRRMVLLAWIGSHAETALARSHATHFAQGTADLAERFLGGAIEPNGRAGGRPMFEDRGAVALPQRDPHEVGEAG